MSRSGTARGAAVMCGLLTSAACSLNFDAADGALPLVGEARDAASYPRLNQDGVASVGILKNDAGAIWVAMFELKKPPLGGEQLLGGQLHHVRLDAPGADEFFPCDGVIYGQEISYVVRGGGGEAKLPRLRLLRPGEGGGIELGLPTRAGVLMPGPKDAVFLFETDADEPGDSRDLIVRSEGSFLSRELPMRPKPQAGQRTRGSRVKAFDPSGDWLLRQDPDGRLFAFSTRGVDDVDLGLHDRFTGIDSREPVAFICGDGGLLRVPIDRSPPTRLDDTPCLIAYVDGFGDIVPDAVRPHELVYHTRGGYFVVPKVGGAITRLATPAGAYLLAVGPQNQAAHANGESYHLNARGDLIEEGFIGDHRFMERGRDARFSADGLRINWLENAARSDNTGDLMSAPATAMGGEAAQLLSRNVLRYSRLADGRLLALSNAAGGHLYSRVIALDEAGRLGHRVAEKSYDYVPIPDRSELLVKVRSGADRIDLHRVPLPIR